MKAWPLLIALCAIGGCAAKEPPVANRPQPAMPNSPRGMNMPPRNVPPPAFAPMQQGLTTRSIILTYHDMVPVRDRNSLWFDCTPKELEEQIDWLTAQGARFVTLGELYLHLIGSKPLPDKAVAICFADNYEGFLKYAWPILDRKNVPVTMFVHTDFVGNRQNRPKMSWDQLRQLTRSRLFSVQSQTASHAKDLSLLTDEQIKDEMVKSKEVLEKNLGRRILMVAYPNGKYDERSKNFAKEAGYLIGFSEKQMPAELSPDIMEVARTVHTKYREAWRKARESSPQP